MISTIIHIADLHIPNNFEDKPFDKMVGDLYVEVAKSIEDLSMDEVRIVISGDIFQHKIKVSNEAVIQFHKMLNMFNEFSKVIVIAGNHDLLENNTDRLDSITPTFEINGVFPNVSYLDKALGYKSGYVVDDNVIWVLYSIFDKFAKPNIDMLRDEYPDKRIIGLYHGNITGSVTDTGYVSETGIDTDVFDVCDCVMAGHIHKFQTIKRNGVPIVYSGSVFQQNFGENIGGHGFVRWNLSDMSYEHIDVPNEYRMLKFEVTSFDDVKEDKERLLNI